MQGYCQFLSCFRESKGVSTSSQPHLLCTSMAPGDSKTPKRSLSLRGWEGRERHPDPHSQPMKSLLSLELCRGAKLNPSSLFFLGRASSKPHAASPDAVSRHQNSGPFLLLRKNWICYPRDKEKYIFCLKGELKPIPSGPLKASQIICHLYHYDAIATDAVLLCINKHPSVEKGTWM